MISSSNILENYLASDARPAQIATYISERPNAGALFRNVVHTIESQDGWQDVSKLRELRELAMRHIYNEETIPRAIMPIRGMTELRLAYHTQRDEREEHVVAKRRCVREEAAPTHAPAASPAAFPAPKRDYVEADDERDMGPARKRRCIDLTSSME